MSSEDAEGEAAEPADAEYWAAVEEIAEETLRPYVALLPAETLEMMKSVMVATLGAHPAVDALTREIVRRGFGSTSGPHDSGRTRVVLVE